MFDLWHDPLVARQWTCVLVCVAVVIGSAEWLMPGHLSARSPFALHDLCRELPADRWGDRWLGRCASSRGARGLFAARMVGALAAGATAVAGQKNRSAPRTQVIDLSRQPAGH